MGRSTQAFRGGYQDSHGITYSLEDMGSHIYASAVDSEGKMSSAHFNFEPDTGSHEVVPGTLNLHPEHNRLGVGRTLRSLVNARY